MIANNCLKYQLITDLPVIPFPNEGTDIKKELSDGARAWKTSEKKDR